MKLQKLLPALFLVTSILIPAVAFSEAGEKLAYKDFLFDISAHQMGSELLVRGIISGGAPCTKLVADISLQDENSNRATVKVIVNNYGGREPFSIRKPINGVRSSRWTVANISVKQYR
jgi:hypothetical protein